MRSFNEFIYLFVFHINIKLIFLCIIMVITKLPNSEQSYKGKVKTHNYINRKKSVNNRKTENRRTAWGNINFEDKPSKTYRSYI